MPSDVIPWSDGKALVAIGIPLDPVPYKGVDYQIGQANNALLYPGLALGTIVCRAKHVTPNMLVAAADAVAGQVDPSQPRGPPAPAGRPPAGFVHHGRRRRGTGRHRRRCRHRTTR